MQWRPDRPAGLDVPQPRQAVRRAGGHETEALGYDGVADSGPVLEDHDEPPDQELEIDRIASESALD